MGTDEIDGGILSILSILSYIKSDLVVPLSITVQYSNILYCMHVYYATIQNYIELYIYHCCDLGT